MWRLLSLNSKLLILLVAVQAIVLSLGVFGLLQWMASERMNDLYIQLDNRSDSLEDLVTIENGRWLYRNNSEGEREIFHDPQFHFAFQDATHHTIIQSEGQASDIRHQLDQRLSVLSLKDGDVTVFTLNDKKWIFERTDIQRNNHDEVVTGTLYTGLNIDSAFAEIELLRHLAITIVMVAIFLTACSSYLVINYSTRNLRKFSHNIRDLQPPFFSGQIVMVPQSAEEKLLFDSYDAMIKTIKASMESQRLFIANATHELKTPIAAALSALEVILAKPRTADDYESTCRDVMAELQVLRRLSHDLLNLARLDEAASLQFHQCELTDVLTRVIARWKKPAEQKNIHLNCDINIEKNNTIPGTTETWEVIIGNLVDNAIKYGKHNGNVWIHAYETQKNTMAISISDDGIGMTQTEIEQLGKVFFRADQARSGVDSFGLGFAHTKQLLENLGGFLTVKQSRQGGIHLILSFPYLSTHIYTS